MRLHQLGSLASQGTHPVLGKKAKLQAREPSAGPPPPLHSLQS